ncbi:MAG: AI-2E family transporter [Hyphomicrobiales bacterium]|nr:AI-2E family transporter [Hyphomicrobiales bacterium]
MGKSDNGAADKKILRRALEITIRIGVVLLLLAWCFEIVRPFIGPVFWGIIIAVAAYPGFIWLRSVLGGRDGLAAIVFSLLALALLIVPSVLLTETLVNGVQQLAGRLMDGSLTIPPPPERVGSWPVVGEPIADFWTLASENLDLAAKEAGPQLRAAGGWLVSMAAAVGFGLLQFIFAIIIAGVLLANAAGGHRSAYAIATRLAGEEGPRYADLAQSTVRSVARGILGVALIQSMLAGLGFLVVGIPAAGLLALLCLVLAIVQIGVGLIVIPTVIYVFSVADPLPAVAFLIWSIFVIVLDNVLKPLLLGRGVKVPMIVIFVGAIGGFLASGIIGLFVGSVVLALGYTLFVAWLNQGKAGEDTAAVEIEGTSSITAPSS